MGLQALIALDHAIGALERADVWGGNDRSAAALAAEREGLHGGDSRSSVPITPLSDLERKTSEMDGLLLSKKNRGLVL